MRFTDPALIAANQQGYLTPEQLDLLSRKMYTSGLSCALVIIPGLWLLFCSLWLGAAVFQGKQVGVAAALLLILPPLTLIGMGFGIFFKHIATRKQFLQQAALGNTPLVERVQGEIVWDQQQKHYTLHIPDYPQALLVAYVGNSGLINTSLTSYLSPGPYHFYLVRGKKGAYIVSAQPIHTSTQMLRLPGTLAETGLPGDEQARLATQNALTSAGSFGPLDLDANRQGQVSAEQLRKLPRRLVRKGILLVHQVTGEVQVHSRYAPQEDGPGSTVYFFEIGGLYFQVSKALAAAWAGKGSLYRVYYLADTETLLSIEALAVPR